MQKSRGVLLPNSALAAMVISDSKLAYCAKKAAIKAVVGLFCLF
jgi:hypothetical protein